MAGGSGAAPTSTRMKNPSVIVVGLGAAGAATLMQLARRGVAVIGMDRFSPPHDRGSSHGETRITRLAIGEGDVYTPLAMRSHALWREIEAETGAELLTQIGVLILQSAQAENGFLKQTIACAQRFGIGHEVIDGDQLAARFPQFGFDGYETGYYEPTGGFLRPEACISAQLQLAERYGATIHRDQAVRDIKADGDGVRVLTDSATYSADRAVLAVGPWIPDFMPNALRDRFAIYRQVLVWYELERDASDHSPQAMPAFIWSLNGDGFFYGFPVIDAASRAIKVASEQFDSTTTADGARDVDPDEPRALYRDVIMRRMPGVSDRVVKAVRCLYTTTPDHNFVVDRHPDSDSMVLVSPCSGHGFKHSAAVGEAVAELVTTGASTVDMSPFSLARLG
jgi:sarcosine oxidase